MDNAINNKLISDLNTAYLQNRLIIFIGAGMSIPIGLPGWSDLIEDICHHYKIPTNKNENNFWKLLDNIQDQGISSNDLKVFIANLINVYENANEDIIRNTNSHNYADLNQPRLMKIFSTNFDNIPQKVIQNLTPINLLELSGTPLAEILSSDSKHIIYLHGNVNQPYSIIVTEADVKKIYSDESWKSTFISALSAYHALFIGMSFSDTYMREFVQQIFENTNNKYAVISLSQLSTIPRGKQIILRQLLNDNEKIQEIRKLLKQIFSDFSETVFLKIPQELDSLQLLEKLKEQFNIRRHFDLSFDNSKYKSLHFSIYDNELSVEKTFECIADILTSYTICDKLHPIIYISQDQNKIQIATNGKANKSFFDKVNTMLELCDDQKSVIYLLDNTSKKVKAPLDFTFFSRLLEKRIEDSHGKHSLLTSPTFEGGNTTGIEVHIACIIITENRLLIESRSSNEANIPDKFSLPGGRVHRGEKFITAVHRKLSDIGSCDSIPLSLLGEFTVAGTDSPGLAYIFDGNCSNIEINSNYQFVNREQLLKFYYGKQFVCDTDVLNAIISRLKAKIKLRIVMLNECNYKCKLCHHENVTQNEPQDIKKMIESLQILFNNFEIEQITITGGEPLLPQNFPMLKRLLLFIREKSANMNLSIISNSYYLTPEVAEELAVYNVRYKLSLYGKNDDAVSEYTCNIINNERYFYRFLNSMRMLGKMGINLTINIPIHQALSQQIYEIFNDNEFASIVKEYNVKIKIIEMVKSPLVDRMIFNNNFVTVDFFKNNKIYTDGSEHFNTEEICINKIYAILYRYPCHASEKCESCFSNFALTMKPNGEMLICAQAKEKSMINKTLFESVPIDFTNFKTVYEL